MKILKYFFICIFLLLLNGIVCFSSENIKIVKINDNLKIIYDLENSIICYEFIEYDNGGYVGNRQRSVAVSCIKLNDSGD